MPAQAPRTTQADIRTGPCGILGGGGAGETPTLLLTAPKIPTHPYLILPRLLPRRELELAVDIQATRLIPASAKRRRTMKFLRAGIAFAAAALLTTGCGYVAPVMPPQGWIYADISAPMDIDVDQTVVTGPRMGEAESTSILALVATGDCSITTAAQNGGVNTVNHVDYAYMNVLFVYQKFTTRVYGE